MMIDRARVTLFLGVLGLFASAAPGVAAPAVSKETLARAERHIKYAERHLEKKEYDQAIEEYRQVNAWVPQPRIDYFLGNAYRMKGDQAKAKECFERYLQIDPSGEYAAEARAFVGGGAGPVKDAQAGLPSEPSPAVAKEASQDKAPAEERVEEKERATAPVQAPVEAVASTAPGVREPPPPLQSPEPVSSVPTQALPPPPETAVLAQPALPPTTATAVAARPVRPAREPIYRRWWLWTIVGSVAAHGAVGAALGITASPAFQSTLPDVGSQSLVRF
jgi:hypothetical protein